MALWVGMVLWVGFCVRKQHHNMWKCERECKEVSRCHERFLRDRCPPTRSLRELLAIFRRHKGRQTKGQANTKPFAT